MIILEGDIDGEYERNVAASRRDHLVAVPLGAP